MTTEEKNLDTKQKILNVSNELFAKFGFEGTSIRDIANAADVNLSAVNYHFQNKENLYWKVFDSNYTWMQTGIEKLTGRDLDTAELAVEVFRFFLSSGPALMNTFKIFLTDSVSRPEIELAMDQERPYGPPGQFVFLKAIERDVGEGVTPASMRWAMKMTFGLVVHYGIIMNTSSIKEKCKSEEDLTPEAIEKSLYHAVKSFLEHLKQNPKLF